jgi:hypothetical protein
VKSLSFLALPVLLGCALTAKEKRMTDSDPAPKVLKLTPLTANEQETLLARRQSGQIFGSFNSFASFLYVVDTVVHTDDRRLAAVTLNSPFPEFYRPTCRELFNAMARQMRCSWSYDATRAYWLFAKPALPMPFKVTLAPGWESEERGDYLFCKPPQAPVGMDIYVMAEFSDASGDAELPAKMREATAVRFARAFKKDVSANDMHLLKVGTYDALHFKTPTPRQGTTWRQWAIAEAGQVIVVVSAMDDALEAQVLPGVEAALKSFEVKPVASK